MRLTRRYRPALLAAGLVTAAAGIGCRHTLKATAAAAQATADVAWPLLWVAGPGLLILAVTWVAIRARRRWQHGLPLRGTWLAAGFATLVVGLVVGTILLFPALLVDHGRQRLPVSQRALSAEQRLKAETDARTGLLQAIAGLVVLVGAGATWRQLHINREGQITERFNKAIDHLGQGGDDKLDVRLGGIYALERIAINSRADRATIAQILTAYVRGHAPWPPTRPGQYSERAPIEQVPSLQTRAADIQGIMSVLARRKHLPAGPVRLDLLNTDLRKASLEDANLQGADLRGANLQGSTLWRANLQGADLKGANLQDADLTGANLQNADLKGANLQDARLFLGNLRDARLWDANLQDADANNANLQGAVLFSADLQGAYLASADLQGAHLAGADLQGAHLAEADLRGAGLQGVNLQGADLRGADLKRAQARDETTWPAGFDWQAAGVQLEREEEEAVGFRFPGGSVTWHHR